jgi:hypothetical protein
LHFTRGYLCVNCQLQFDNWLCLQQIIINDTNDNAPTFPPPSIVHLSISESLLPDDPSAIFSLPVAVDADSLPNGIVGYRLETFDNSTGYIFRLIVSLNSSEPEVKLALNRPLDRESRDEYQLKLIAYDGGSPVQTGSLLIRVEVEDANDNSPMFQQSTYHVELSESAAVGTRILTASATDPDTGHNGDVRYRLSARGQGRDDFRIDDVTGEVTLARRLDCVRQSTYTFGLVAEDQAVSSRSAYSLLTVHVIDVNDHPPVIALHTADVVVGGPNHIAVPAPSSELGTLAETFVAHVSVSDSDSGDNGRVACSLADITPRGGSTGHVVNSRRMSDNYTREAVTESEQRSDTQSDATIGRYQQTYSRKYTFSLTSLYDKEYKIMVTANNATPNSLHSDGDDSRYLLQITCHDYGLPNAMTSSTKVSVIILPRKNEFVVLPTATSSEVGLPTIAYPKPENDTVHISSKSAAVVGHAIARVVATSSGVDGRLAYELVDGNGSSHFRIDRSSGHVIVAQPVDVAQLSPTGNGSVVTLQLVLGVSYADRKSAALSLATLFVVVDSQTETTLVPDATHLGRHGFQETGVLIRLTPRTSWPLYVAIFAGSFIVVFGLILFVAIYVVCRRQSRDRNSRKCRDNAASSYHVAFEFSSTPGVSASGSLCALNNATLLLGNSNDGSINSLSGSTDDSGNCLQMGPRNSTNTFRCKSISNEANGRRCDVSTGSIRMSPALPDIVLVDLNPSTLDVSRMFTRFKNVYCLQRKVKCPLT